MHEVRKRIREKEEAVRSSLADEFSKYLAFLLAFVFIVVLDQTSKAFALHGAFNVVCNVRFAFGIGLNSPNLNISIILAVLLITAVAVFKVKSDLSKLALTLVFAGGVSNLVDRYLGDSCVIDIFHLPFWPSFNIADSAITLGGILLIFSLFVKRKK